MSENSKTTWLIWILGAVLSLILTIGGYNINLNLENEARLTKIESELSQVKSEVKDLWKKYNSGMDQKTEVLSGLILLKYKVDHLEDELHNLKKRR